MNDLNPTLAHAVLTLALEWGVRDFVVCTGARNAPLVLPLLQQGDGIRVWNHFDERAAGFFALGLSKRDRTPVAVITTSGTAVAELLPPVIEAHYSGLPLVLITADRPKRFRGSGAPQAIEQPGVFGEYVEACHDVAVAEELPEDLIWSRARPIHINPCFEEPRENVDTLLPLLKTAFNRVESFTQPCLAGDSTLLSRFLEDFSDGLVVLGEIDAADRVAVAGFLRRLNAPVWAEATSRLREVADLPILRAGERFFRHRQPAKVLRIGGIPSLRLWRDLEDQPEVPVLSVTRNGFSGLARPSQTIGWLDFADVSVPRKRKSEFSDPYEISPLYEEYPQSEPAMVHRLSKRIPPAARVFLGNSLPIREWNLAAAFEVPHFDCFANRGANGIDGGISTFLGLSEGAEEAWGIFGDLTSLYDLNAPWVSDQLGQGKRRIVIINNGGGRIFSRLPVLGSLGDAEKAITENRHETRFKHWARMWGWLYRDVQHFAEFHDPRKSHAVIELLPDATETAQFWAAYETEKINKKLSTRRNAFSG